MAPRGISPARSAGFEMGLLAEANAISAMQQKAEEGVRHSGVTKNGNMHPLTPVSMPKIDRGSHSRRSNDSLHSGSGNNAEKTTAGAWPPERQRPERSDSIFRKRMFRRSRYGNVYAPLHGRQIVFDLGRRSVIGHSDTLRARARHKALRAERKRNAVIVRQRSVIIVCHQPDEIDPNDQVKNQERPRQNEKGPLAAWNGARRAIPLVRAVARIMTAALPTRVVTNSDLDMPISEIGADGRTPPMISAGVNSIANVRWTRAQRATHINKNRRWIRGDPSHVTAIRPRHGKQ